MLFTIVLALLATTLTVNGACVDKEPIKCAAWTKNNFCNNEYYTDSVKKQYCAASCNLCDACLDTDHRCPQWKANNFCVSTKYSLDEIQGKCNMTCGFCI